MKCQIISYKVMTNFNVIIVQVALIGYYNRYFYNHFVRFIEKLHNSTMNNLGWNWILRRSA